MRISDSRIDQTMSRCAWLLLPLLLFGCRAPATDIPADASSATGIANAILIRDGETAPSDAANVPAGQKLSAAEALRLALARDPRIGAAVARVRIAQAGAQQARLLPNPIVNIDFRFPEGGGQAIAEATLTGDLIAILEAPGRIKAADQRLRGAVADAITTILDVISELEQNYASAQSVDAQFASLDERAKIVQQLRDLAQRRFDAGDGTRLDVLTLDSQRAQLMLDLSDLRIQKAEQRLALARRIGQPRDAADWELDPWQPAPPIQATEEAWLDAALVGRPEIQSRAWELAALGEEVKLSRTAILDGGDIGVHGEHDQKWAVGPTITTPIPIFDFGQGARARAQAARVQAHHELAQQQLEVIEDVRVAYATYSASRAALEEAQNEILPLLQQQREQAELAYKSGDTDLTTLLLAETGLAETRARVVQLQEKAALALVHLRRAAGGAGVAGRIEQMPPATRPTTETTGPSR
jgi:outer membrane protein TolC